jgi:hypothetical protein
MACASVRADDGRDPSSVRRKPGAVRCWAMRRGSLIALLVLAWASIVLLRRLLRWPRLWEGTIRDFDREPVTPGAIVFMGSSSIRFWETLGRDMAPLPAQNRGFGGATVAGVNVYARRILARLPHPRDPLAVVRDLDLQPDERAGGEVGEFDRAAQARQAPLPGGALGRRDGPPRGVEEGSLQVHEDLVRLDRSAEVADGHGDGRLHDGPPRGGPRQHRRGGHYPSIRLPAGGRPDRRPCAISPACPRPSTWPCSGTCTAT